MAWIHWHEFPLWFDPDLDRHYRNVFRVGGLILHGFTKYARWCGLWPGTTPSGSSHDLNLRYAVVDTVLCLNRLVDYWQSLYADEYKVDEWEEQLGLLRAVSRQLDTHFSVSHVLESGLQSVTTAENSLSLRLQGRTVTPVRVGEEKYVSVEVGPIDKSLAKDIRRVLKTPPVDEIQLDRDWWCELEKYLEPIFAEAAREVVRTGRTMPECGGFMLGEHVIEPVREDIGWLLEPFSLCDDGFTVAGDSCWFRFRKACQEAAAHIAADTALVEEPGNMSQVTGGEVSGETTSAGQTSNTPTLTNAATVAWGLYKSARDRGSSQLGNDPTDGEVWAWLEEREELPPRLNFDTWQRNLRRYRRATGTQKNTPRSGRPTGRSIVTESDS